MRSRKERIAWIDCAKGIAILLVIVGHTVYDPRIRGAIFSFHMPLFFMLSGAAGVGAEDLAQWRRQTRKGAEKLLLPAVVLFSLRLVLMELMDIAPLPSLREYGLALWYSSGVNVGDAPAIGMVWFLVVLFFARCLMGLIQPRFRSWVWPVTLGFSAIGVWLGGQKWLPLSMDLVLAVMIFFPVGAQLCRLEKKPVVSLILASAIWVAIRVYLGSGTYMELAVRRYPAAPLSYLGAIAATAAICCISMGLVRLKWPGKVMCFLGEHSMALLCVHYMDILWRAPWYDLTYGGLKRQMLAAVIRVGMDLALFGILMWGKRLWKRKS